MSKRDLPQYDENGVTNYCFGCDEIRSKCECEGGYKIAYYRFVPMSAEEIKNIPKQKTTGELFAELRENLKDLGEQIGDKLK